MRLRFLVVSVTLAFLLFSGTAFSQTFNALFDGYYAWNLNKPENQLTTARSFDFRHQQFALNYGELSIQQTPGPIGYRFDFGFGDTTTAMVAASPVPAQESIYRHVQQAFVSVKKEDLTVDFGKFVTPLGAEVIETKDNWNYSRSLLFNYAIPLYHFGARATYAVSDKTTLAAYVVNGWNNVVDNNTAKSIGLMATFKPADKLAMTENYLLGNENTDAGFKTNRRHTFDSIATYEFNKKFTEMANYDYLMDMNPSATKRRMQGIAAYTKISPNGQDTGFKIIPRYEWLKDDNGGFTGQPQTLQEATITFQSVSKDMGTFWAEYRRDWSNKQGMFFVTEQTGTRSRLNQDTILFGYTVSFTKDFK
jgi:hypothetical protein